VVLITTAEVIDDGSMYAYVRSEKVKLFVLLELEDHHVCKSRESFIIAEFVKMDK
jgi:hypothetical protein